jgi:glycosyltransferase involved in cell wall biosynthesis
MSRALAARGHVCTILTLDLGITDQNRKDLSGSILIVVPCVLNRFYLPAPKLNVFSDAVRNADIVHLMGHWTIINAIAYYFIRKFNKKYVVCPAGALPIFGRSRLIKKIYNLFVGTRLVRNASANIAIAMSEFAHYEAYGVPRSRIFHVPNGINPLEQDPATRDIRSQLMLSDSPYILFIGRLNHIKGPDLLIEAFGLIKDQFPNHLLILAGPDEGLKSNLILRSRALGIENRVHFVGYVGGAMKSELLVQADLMVIPSRQEAMSIVLLEAGLAKIPLVLTDQCGLNELQDMHLATVVKVSALNIAHGIQHTLSSRKTSLEAAMNLNEYIIENFLWQTIAFKLERLFTTVLKV